MGEFVGDALVAGDPAVVIATPAHREAFAARLSALGFDVPAARASRQLTMLDARETLETFLVDAMPDWSSSQGRSPA